MKKIIALTDDEAPRIPSGLENKIFERFYNDWPPDEVDRSVSGLELNNSKNNTESHSGNLTFSNQTNKISKCLGAQFTIYLPVV